MRITRRQLRKLIKEEVYRYNMTSASQDLKAFAKKVFEIVKGAGVTPDRYSDVMKGKGKTVSIFFDDEKNKHTVVVKLPSNQDTTGVSDVLRDKGYFVEAKPDYQNDMIILHVSKEM